MHFTTSMAAALVLARNAAVNGQGLIGIGEATFEDDGNTVTVPLGVFSGGDQIWASPNQDDRAVITVSDATLDYGSAHGGNLMDGFREACPSGTCAESFQIDSTFPAWVEGGVSTQKLEITITDAVGIREHMDTISDVIHEFLNEVVEAGHVPKEVGSCTFRTCGGGRRRRSGGLRLSLVKRQWEESSEDPDDDHIWSNWGPATIKMEERVTPDEGQAPEDAAVKYSVTMHIARAESEDASGLCGAVTGTAGSLAGMLNPLFGAAAGGIGAFLCLAV